MAQWYVKELSQITAVSVQTLHHYDRIGLLTPSVRLPNGYRLYSEKDLLKLQQIIALKFFGFELAQIKRLLTDENILEHLAAQATLLQEKANVLSKASETLKNITDRCDDIKSIPWQRIIELIEVYRMTEQLKNAWVSQFLSADELREYAAFEKELLSKPATEKQRFEQEWEQIVKDINANLNNDPTNATSIDIAKRCMQRVNALYTQKYFHVRKAVWEKGFKGNTGSETHGLSQEAVAWLDKAIYAYHVERVRNVLSKIGQVPDKEVRVLWDEILNDIAGNTDACRRDFMDKVINGGFANAEVTAWLNKYYG